MNELSVALPAAASLTRLDDDACASLRGRLVAAGYDLALLGQAESIAPRQFDAVRLPLVHAWLERRGGPGAILARLFAYEASVDRAELDRTLSADLGRRLLDAEVLRLRGDGALESAYRLTPFEGLYVLSDPPHAGPETAMGPGPTTLELAWQVPAHAGDVLDLGCGAGSLALVAAARGARRAVGVDLNERAVVLSGFNARLNGLAAEFRTGDLLDPVRGERFDLVLGQPPYVALPEGLAATTYLHGGARGDELALKFAVGAITALADGGRAFLYFDAAPAREPVHARIRAALGDAPADLVALVAPGPSLDLQAAAYASLEDEALGPRYRDAARRYRAHLASIGEGTFNRVLLVLMRSEVPGGSLTAQLPVGSRARFAAAALAALLRGLALASSRDEPLLAATVRLTAGGCLVEERKAGALEGEPVRSVQFPPEALTVGHEITEAGAFLFAALDASASVREAVERFAAACGEPPEAVRQKVLDFAREGLGRGLLVPA